jgi:hypothetical protein
MNEAENNRPAPANPYAAPRSNVSVAADTANGTLIENGRAVSMGRGAGWLADGFDLFRQSPGIWMLLTVIFIFGLMILSVIPLVNLALNLLLPVLIAGLLLGCRALDEGDALQVETLFAGFKENVGQLVLVGLIYLGGIIVIGMFAALAAFGVMGASLFSGASPSAMGPAAAGIFLIVVLVAMALVLPLLMAFWFAPALVVFHEQDAVGAMKQSFFGCLKNILPLLLFGFLSMVLTVLATLPILLGWLVIWPMFIGALYSAYKDVFLDSDAPAGD